MRGLLPVCELEEKASRITPACAGTTVKLTCNNFFLRDHPCMCGDYAQPKRGVCIGKGSPLHVRGLRRLTIARLWLLRITPACAGTTVNLTFTSHLGRDHPCMCGDYYRSVWRDSINRGSPLHVRGLLFTLLSYMI